MKYRVIFQVQVADDDTGLQVTEARAEPVDDE